MAKHYDFDEEFETDEIIDRVSNGEDSDYFVRKEDGIYCSDGKFICDNDDEEYQDKIDKYKEEWSECNWFTEDWADRYGVEWSECNWFTEDWADRYGVDPEDVGDAMDDDIKDLY